jgi:hypothetical protein
MPTGLSRLSTFFCTLRTIRSMPMTLHVSFVLFAWNIPSSRTTMKSARHQRSTCHPTTHSSSLSSKTRLILHSPFPTHTNCIHQVRTLRTLLLQRMTTMHNFRMSTSRLNNTRKLTLRSFRPTSNRWSQFRPPTSTYQRFKRCFQTCWTGSPMTQDCTIMGPTF